MRAADRSPVGQRHDRFWCDVVTSTLQHPHNGYRSFHSRGS